jgi:hypothetical protein
MRLWFGHRQIRIRSATESGHEGMPAQVVNSSTWKDTPNPFILLPSVPTEPK